MDQLDWKEPQPDTPRVNAARERGTVSIVLEACALEREVTALREAATALIADVQRRYPGEALRCPYMIALDAALAKADA